MRKHFALAAIMLFLMALGSKPAQAYVCYPFIENPEGEFCGLIGTTLGGSCVYECP